MFHATWSAHMSKLQPMYCTDIPLTFVNTYFLIQINTNVHSMLKFPWSRTTLIACATQSYVFGQGMLNSLELLNGRHPGCIAARNVAFKYSA